MPITLSVSDILATHRAVLSRSIALLDAHTLHQLADELIDAGEYSLAVRVLACGSEGAL